MISGRGGEGDKLAKDLAGWALWHILCNIALRRAWRATRCGRRRADAPTTPQGAGVSTNFKILKTKKILRTMTIKPLSDRVLIKPAEAEVKTAGGIIIPD